MLLWQNQKKLNILEKRIADASTHLASYTDKECISGSFAKGRLEALIREESNLVVATPTIEQAIEQHFNWARQTKTKVIPSWGKEREKTDFNLGVSGRVPNAVEQSAACFDFPFVSLSFGIIGAMTKYINSYNQFQSYVNYISQRPSNLLKLHPHHRHVLETIEMHKNEFDHVDGSDCHALYSYASIITKWCRKINMPPDGFHPLFSSLLLGQERQRHVLHMFAAISHFKHHKVLHGVIESKFSVPVADLDIESEPVRGLVQHSDDIKAFLISAEHEGVGVGNQISVNYPRLGFEFINAICKNIKTSDQYLFYSNFVKQSHSNFLKCHPWAARVRTTISDVQRDETTSSQTLSFTETVESSVLSWFELTISEWCRRTGVTPVQLLDDLKVLQSNLLHALVGIPPPKWVDMTYHNVMLKQLSLAPRAYDFVNRVVQFKRAHPVLFDQQLSFQLSISEVRFVEASQDLQTFLTAINISHSWATSFVFDETRFSVIRRSQPDPRIGKVPTKRISREEVVFQLCMDLIRGVTSHIKTYADFVSYASYISQSREQLLHLHPSIGAIDKIYESFVSIFYSLRPDFMSIFKNDAYLYIQVSTDSDFEEKAARELSFEAGSLCVSMVENWCNQLNVPPNGLMQFADVMFHDKWQRHKLNMIVALASYERRFGALSRVDERILQAGIDLPDPLAQFKEPMLSKRFKTDEVKELVHGCERLQTFLISAQNVHKEVVRSFELLLGVSLHMGGKCDDGCVCNAMVSDVMSDGTDCRMHNEQSFCEKTPFDFAQQAIHGIIHNFKTSDEYYAYSNCAQKSFDHFADFHQSAEIVALIFRECHRRRGGKVTFSFVSQGWTRLKKIAPQIIDWCNSTGVTVQRLCDDWSRFYDIIASRILGLSIKEWDSGFMLARSTFINDDGLRHFQSFLVRVPLFIIFKN